MSKRKRASLGKTSTGADQLGSEPNDAAVKEDMAHVTPDVLAGSPNIFAPKWGPQSDETAKADAPVTEPVAAGAPSAPNEVPIEKVEPLEPASPPIAMATAPPYATSS